MSHIDMTSIPLSKQGYKRIRPVKIINFLQQLVTLLEAGFPIIQALDHMLESADHRSIQQMIFFLRSQIYAGATLSQALKQYPKHFNDIHCHLIEIGEKTGSLTIALKQVIDEKQKNESLKRNIKKALSYPTVVLIVSALVTFGLSIYVIPEFASLYDSFAVELPFITQYIIQISHWLQSFGFLMLILLIISILSIKFSAQRSQKCRYLLHYGTLNLPFIGQLIAKATVIRIARTLSMSLNAGVSMVDAMDLISKTIRNQVYVHAIHHASNDIRHGQSLYTALLNLELFPSLSLQMIKIGENTGIMPEMLQKTADFYEQEIKYIIDHLNHYFEPIITIILGLIVGTIVIAIYLPIFKLGSIF
jgi:type IV pilus assembly protein PilC